MELKELAEAIKKCWSKETSQDPRFWSPESPSAGQCLVTALVVQDFFGGAILEAVTYQTIRGKNYRLKHFWNRIADGQEIDFTRDQFPEGTIIPKGISRTRISLLSVQHTRDKYKLLKSRVEKLIEGSELNFVPF